MSDFDIVRRALKALRRITGIGGGAMTYTFDDFERDCRERYGPLGPGARQIQAVCRIAARDALLVNSRCVPLPRNRGWRLVWPPRVRGYVE